MFKWNYPAFLFLLLCSCGEPEKEVTITLTSEEEIPGIIDEVTYERDGEFIEGPEVLYDSVRKTYCAQWRNVPTGEYSIAATYVLLGGEEQTFNISSDTTVVIKNVLPFRQVGYLPLAEMMNADTLEFVRVISGCFSFDVRKYVLIKDQGTYAYSSEPTAQFQSQWRQIKNAEAYNLIAEFKRMEDEIEVCRWNDATGARAHPGTIVSYTTRQYVFIRADDVIYTYDDEGARWRGYTTMLTP